MSVIGTGIAAGVANTGQAAKQQTATKSGRDANRAGAADQTDKFTISQLQGAGATRDADEEMPDGQAPGYENVYTDDHEPPEDTPNPNDHIHDSDAPISSPTNLPLQSTYDPAAKEVTLFHAIDVKA
jgi:hypothetical protein